jgi:hypothetical protein
MKTLIARWNNWDPMEMEQPDLIRWSDGTDATFADFRRHRDDTCRSVAISSKCYERHFYPGLVAEVAFDTLCGHWVISGNDIEPRALHLSDAFATNDQIAEEMYTLPIFYKYRICRAAGSGLVQ